MEFYTESEGADARLHEEVDTLIVGTRRSGHFGVERSLVVEHEQVAADERYAHIDLVAEPFGGQVVTQRKLAQADIGHAVDIVRKHRHAVAAVGIEGLGVGNLLVVGNPYAAVLAGVGRILRNAEAVHEGLRGRYAAATDTCVDQHAERNALVGELVVPAPAEAGFGVAGEDVGFGIGIEQHGVGVGIDIDMTLVVGQQAFDIEVADRTALDELDTVTAVVLIDLLDIDQRARIRIAGAFGNQLLDLVAVHREVEGRGPREIAPCVLVSGRSLDTPVIDLAGVDVFLFVAGAGRCVVKEELVVGVGIVVGSRSRDLVAQELDVETGLERLGTLGFEVLGRSDRRRAHHAVGQRVVGTGDVTFGSVAHLGIGFRAP